MNMIPVDFDKLILDDEDDNIDIFDPIEQLNGQCFCEFYMTNPSILEKKLNKNPGKKHGFRLSIIEDFLEQV